MEILIVLGILGLLFASALVVTSTLRGGPDLQAEARELSRVLELAKSKTVASQGDTRYGVYATSTSPHRYILFQGNDYASRAVAEDKVYELLSTIEFDSISFGGAVPEEVIFDRIQGTTGQAGSAVLRIKAEPSNITTVYVESSGVVEIDSNAVPNDDDLISDSRHVHVTHSRGIDQINTATENMILDFDPFPATTITIADFLSGGQFVWEDTIIVDGEEQILKIHTHKLNGNVAGNFVTEFSIHRDLRFNTKAMNIELSGDATGTLVEYADNGNITEGTSIYDPTYALQ